MEMLPSPSAIVENGSDMAVGALAGVGIAASERYLGKWGIVASVAGALGISTLVGGPRGRIVAVSTGMALGPMLFNQVAMMMDMNN